MKKLPHGQIFAVPLPDGTYVFGRVLLDVHGTLKRRLFPVDSPLPGMGQAYLVEMYSRVQQSPEYVPSTVLIPGAFVESKAVGNMWPIVGSKAVDPCTVEFPESTIGFTHATGQIAFECGEMSIPLPLSRAEQHGINAMSLRHSAYLWPFVCLWEMGRRMEVPDEYKMARLAGTDLRMSPQRPRVYEHLPFPMEMSYFEKQAQMGLHLERLYE